MARHHGKVILLALIVLLQTACATSSTLQYADVSVPAAEHLSSRS